MNLRSLGYLALLMLASCTSVHTEKGIEPVWRSIDSGQFQAGVTKQSEVLDALGPPSQVISTHDGIVFYYLHESSVGKGRIFIIYNTAEMQTRYDRAVFFFDGNGVLEDFAYSASPPSTEPDDS